MTDESTNTQPVNTTTEAAPETNAVKMFTQAELDQHIKERLDRADKQRKEAIEKARIETERETLAKNQEWEKLAKQHEADLLKERERIKELELNELRHKAAAMYQLPPEIAERLRGDNLEALEKDAEGLKALIPAVNKQGKLNATNPSSGEQVTETREQKFKRLGF